MNDTSKRGAPGIKRVALMVSLPLVLLIAGGAYWIYTNRYVSTDNAYLHADSVMISPEVSGRVAAIPVHENQAVSKGDVLMRIDAAPYRIAVAAAQAKLDAVSNQVASLRANYRAAQAELRADEESVAYLTRENRRKHDLVKRDVVSSARYDELHHQLEMATQKAQATREQIQQILAQLGGNPDLPLEKQAAYMQAQAALDKARLDLEHTVVRAPASGVVTQVQLNPGDMIGAGHPGFALVETDHFWVDANLKETQLTKIKVGQPARIEIDTYPEHIWKGHIESISPATGAVFSVLPPQNATGNWVKVVQRLAVRVSIDDPAAGPALRAGLSAEVRVDTKAKADTNSVVASR